MQNEYLVGLDIGTSKVTCIISKVNSWQKLEIVGVGNAISEGVSKGAIVNIIKTVEAIKKAVEKAENMAGVKVTNVYVGISGQKIKSHLRHETKILKNNNEPITQADAKAFISDLYRLQLAPGEEILHVIPQEYIIDYELRTDDPVGMCGSRMECNFVILTAPSNAINNIYRCVEMAGLKCDKICLSSLASSSTVLTNEEKEAGIIMLDIGAGTTEMALYKEKILRHCAVVPFAGEDITEDIKTVCKIVKVQAEQLKTRYGSSMASLSPSNEVVEIPGFSGHPSTEISLKSLAIAIQCRLEEIVEFILKEVINSGYNNKIIAGFVLTGAGSNLKYFAEFIKWKTGLNARISAPPQCDFLDEDSKQLVSNPSYSTSVGLLYLALEHLILNKPEPKINAIEEVPVLEEIAEPLKQHEPTNVINKPTPYNPYNDDEEEEEKESKSMFNNIFKTIRKIIEN